MKNPYIELHRAFCRAGARVLISSGQACVLFGIAAFSVVVALAVEQDETLGPMPAE
jgi:hypothetical protein